MFVGHFAVGVALKGADKTIPLWALLLAVQFVDILAMIFILLGWERMDIVPGFTKSNDLDMFMPLTHSLIMTPIWCAIGARLYKFYDHTATRGTLIVIALAVASHWLLDLLVHTPDMPIFFSEDVKVGFGLWNMPLFTIAIETIMVILAIMIYRHAIEGHAAIGKMMIVLFGVLLFFAAHTLVIHIPTETADSAALTGLGVFLALPLLAYLSERRNSS